MSEQKLTAVAYMPTTFVKGAKVRLPEYLTPIIGTVYGQVGLPLTFFGESYTPIMLSTGEMVVVKTADLRSVYAHDCPSCQCPVT